MWNHEVALGIEQNLSYGCRVPGQWGQGRDHAFPLREIRCRWWHRPRSPAGSASGLNVQSDPGQCVVAELSASRGVLKARVHYSVHLTGSVALNYDPPLLGHHFYARSVSSFQGRPAKKDLDHGTEDIELGDYSNATVIIRQQQGGHWRHSPWTTASPGHRSSQPTPGEGDPSANSAQADSPIAGGMEFAPACGFRRELCARGQSEFRERVGHVRLHSSRRDAELGRYFRARRAASEQSGNPLLGGGQSVPAHHGRHIALPGRAQAHSEVA